MKKRDNILPPPDYLLYQEIHDYVEITSKEDKSKKNIIEQKLFYIIDALSIYIYGMPIFKSTYTAMHQGPVEKKIYDIQKNRKNITKNPKELTQRELEFYKKTALNLFEAVKKGIEKDYIELDSNTLSLLTHTPEWAHKYDQFSKAKGTSEEFKRGKMSKKDILRFSIDVLAKDYKDFLNFVKEEMKKI